MVGSNITITNNVISSTSDVFQADFELKQDVLTAGSNIIITGSLISSSVEQGPQGEHGIQGEQGPQGEQGI